MRNQKPESEKPGRETNTYCKPESEKPESEKPELKIVEFGQCVIIAIAKLALSI